MAGTVRRFINVSTDEVYGESSLGKDKGESEFVLFRTADASAAVIAGYCSFLLLIFCTRQYKAF